LEFRWDGKPILICEKNRNKNKGQFANNVYYFTAESGFGFGNDNQAVSKDRDMVNETVGNTMSTYRDTKKNYNFKKNKNLKKNILLEMNNGISEGMTVERNSIKEEDEDLERVLRGLGGRLAEGS
jgi:hypothetical protein